MEFLVPLVFFAIGVYVLYWTVRYAVRHALEDADERRRERREAVGPATRREPGGADEAEDHRGADGRDGRGTGSLRPPSKGRHGRSIVDRSGRSRAAPRDRRRRDAPGRRETLRINGRARIVSDAPFFADMVVEGHRPILALVVEIDASYFHCGRSAVRSGVRRRGTPTRRPPTRGCSRRPRWSSEPSTSSPSTTASSTRGSSANRRYPPTPASALSRSIDSSSQVAQNSPTTSSSRSIDPASKSLSWYLVMS